MNQEKFIEIVKVAIEQPSIEGVIANLKQPPGRRPEAEDIALSRWFNKLREEDKEFVRKVIRAAVKNSVFGFLCILDGVRPIHETNDNEGEVALKLIYKDSKEEVVLNDPSDDYLHDIYRSF